MGKKKGGNPHDKDGDGTPDVPDSDLELASLGNDFTTLCGEGQTPVECWYLRQPMDMLEAPLNLNSEDLNMLLLAIFFDVKKRDVSGIGYYGRGVYDTPFWNAWGLLPGDICVDDTCYKRQEVNYIAQGMWAAHSGHSIEKSHSTVENWKDIYIEDPSPETYYWNDVGYYAYISLNPYYSELSVVYK